MDFYAFLDIETSGTDPEKDNIIEVGAVIAAQGEIIDRYSTLVYFNGKLPARIKRLTGISEEMLKDAPSLTDIEQSLLRFLGEMPLVGHNIAFDIAFLNRKLGREITNPVLDTVDLVQFLLPQAASYRLEYLKDLLGLTSRPSHRALDDAETACSLFFKCLELVKGINREVLFKVYEMTKDRKWMWARTLYKHTAQLIASFSAGRSSEPVYAFMKTDQTTEPALFSVNADQVPKLAENFNLSSFLEPDGSFAQKNLKYRFRAGQVEMLQTVAEGLREGKLMVVEAGTGTGKTLAYLIPAVAWAVSNTSKVIVATHTINLQEQIWNKDLPDVSEITGLQFQAAIVKGRNNYLCLRRWETKLNESEFLEETGLIFCLKVLVWLIQTTTGDRNELNVSPHHNQYWNEISSDQETCIGSACRWHQKHCFVTKARRKADSAELLIVNHSLLLADLKLQNRLLPSYDYLILDEAHHLENSATEQLGNIISINLIKNQLLSLSRGFGSGLGPGFLHQLRQYIKNNPWHYGIEDATRFESSIEDAFEALNGVHESVDEMETFLKNWAAGIQEDSDDNKQLTIRIKHSMRAGDFWHYFDTIKENFVGRSRALSRILHKIQEMIESTLVQQQSSVQALIRDLDFQIKFLAGVNESLDIFCQGGDESVWWIEIEKKARGDTRLRSAPVSVSELLEKWLFQTKKSVLLTSATICVDGKFDYFIERVGLTPFLEDRLVTKQVASPFNYEKQSLLCIVRDLPDPTDGLDNYSEAVVPFITDVARLFNGRTLVLFTSHKMLREVYFKLQPILEQDGIVVLGHRIDGGRTRLIEEFKISDKTILLGTSSFWEGIDLPRDILRCVVIARLPFSPPNTPVVEARIEALIKQKKDAFGSYTVPEAVIRLKQGFGRLIRTEEDDGIVVILDRRITDRKYGRKFLNSLPARTHFKGDTPTVLQKIWDWVHGERPEFTTPNLLEDVEDLEKYLKNIKRKKNR